MEIIHVDLGYGAGIAGATCIENETYNPVNGIAFTKSSVTVTLPVPSSLFTLSSSISFTSVVNLRFSVYLNLNAGAIFTVGFKNSEGTHLNFDYNSNGFHDIVLTKYAKYTRTYDTVLSTIANEKRSLNHYCIRNIDGNISTFDSQSVTGRSVLTDNKLASVFGNALYFTFPAASEGECYVSNVIVARAASENEVLISDIFPVRLPLSTPPAGDFISAGDSEYVGNTSGQKLLQTINASDVITKFGASSKVKYLAVSGNPGYRVGSGITQASGISEESGTITSHGTTALSTDTGAAAFIAWETPNTTLPDLDGLKVGWQV